MEVQVRRATATDFPAVLELARRTLGWTDDDARFLEWKHLENPFGASTVAIHIGDAPPGGERVVGFRAFMRWEFLDPSGRTVVAGRAVDTATDPEFQGQGIFTRLTLEAVGALPAEGVELIFNTPNDKSRPGYLKMGWQEVGRLPVAVLPTSLRFPVVVATARRPAGRHPVPTTAGADPVAVFGGDDAAAVDQLLAGMPNPRGLSTLRSAAFLAWRYGHEGLGYRVVLAGDTPADGFAVFRRRRRGRAVEGVLCEVACPHGAPAAARRLVRRVAALADADYLIRLDPRPVTRDLFVRLPGVGPVLACRPLLAPGSTTPEGSGTVPVPAEWALTMGDVELF